MKNFLNIVLGVSMLAMTGCYESMTLVSVNKDGKGKIVIRELFSPQITSMMEGMEQVAEEMGEAMGVQEQQAASPEASEDVGMFADMIAKRADKLGAGVKLEKRIEKKDEKGWKGYQATYVFEDINKIRLQIGEMDMESDSESMKSESGPIPAYTFEFIPGDTATLKIIPIQEEPAASAEEEEPDSEEMQTDDMSGAVVTQMMATMLKGMRTMFMVCVQGEILDTNAKYRSQKRPNLLTVVDIPFDKMSGNPEALEIMSASEKDPDALAKLLALDIPGVKIEEPDKTITVQFR